MGGNGTVGLGGNGTLVKTALSVFARVNEVRVVQRQFDGAVHNVVSSLDTEHKRMVLVADLVPPATEPTSRVDAKVLKLREKLRQDALTLESGRGVTVVKFAVVGRDDLVLGLDQIGVNQALDAVLEKVGLVDRLQTRLRNLQHDRPVRTLLSLSAARLAAVAERERRKLSISLRLVVWGVIGEDSGPVEGRVVFREVELD